MANKLREIPANSEFCTANEVNDISTYLNNKISNPLTGLTFNFDAMNEFKILSSVIEKLGGTVQNFD